MPPPASYASRLGTRTTSPLPLGNDLRLSQLRIGDHISVFWPKVARYYPGTVTRMHPDGRHHVDYTDGNYEDLFLSCRQWNFLDAAAVRFDAFLSSTSDVHRSPSQAAPSLDALSDDDDVVECVPVQLPPLQNFSKRVAMTLRRSLAMASRALPAPVSASSPDRAPFAQPESPDTALKPEKPKTATATQPAIGGAQGVSAQAPAPTIAITSPVAASALNGVRSTSPRRNFKESPLASKGVRRSPPNQTVITRSPSQMFSDQAARAGSASAAPAKDSKLVVADGATTMELSPTTAGQNVAEKNSSTSTLMPNATPTHFSRVERRASFKNVPGPVSPEMPRATATVPASAVKSRPSSALQTARRSPSAVTPAVRPRPSWTGSATTSPAKRQKVGRKLQSQARSTAPDTVDPISQLRTALTTSSDWRHSVTAPVSRPASSAAPRPTSSAAPRAVTSRAPRTGTAAGLQTPQKRRVSAPDASASSPSRDLPIRRSLRLQQNAARIFPDARVVSPPGISPNSRKIVKEVHLPSRTSKHTVPASPTVTGKQRAVIRKSATPSNRAVTDAQYAHFQFPPAPTVGRTSSEKTVLRVPPGVHASNAISNIVTRPHAKLDTGNTQGGSLEGFALGDTQHASSVMKSNLSKKRALGERTSTSIPKRHKPTPRPRPGVKEGFSDKGFVHSNGVGNGHSLNAKALVQKNSSEATPAANDSAGVSIPLLPDKAVFTPECEGNHHESEIRTEAVSVDQQRDIYDAVTQKQSVADLGHAAVAETFSSACPSTMVPSVNQAFASAPGTGSVGDKFVRKICDTIKESNQATIEPFMTHTVTRLDKLETLTPSADYTTHGLLQYIREKIDRKFDELNSKVKQGEIKMEAMQKTMEHLQANVKKGN